MSKVCRMGRDAIWVDSADGKVKMCGWTNYYLGTLKENTIEELWHGKRAKVFRESMLDGSYRFCDGQACTYMANDNREMVECDIPEYPKYLSMSYERGCNYVCLFCRKEKFLPKVTDKNDIERVEDEISKFIDQVDTLSANGAGELFTSKSIMNCLGKVTPRDDLHIGLETNGSLFNKTNWEKISNLGKNYLSVTVTVHSFHERTYQLLSGTDLPIKNIKDNLRFISQLRTDGVINRFIVSSVICEANYREMPEIVDKCLNEYKADAFRLRFFEPYSVRGKEIEWFLDVRNPYHPYHEDYLKVMEHPILQDKRIINWQAGAPSYFDEHPYHYQVKKVNFLSKLLNTDHLSKEAKELFNGKRIAIYGCGAVGRGIAAFLSNQGYKFETFYDEYYCGNQVNGHRVNKLRADNCDCDLLIIATNEYKNQIKKIIVESGYSREILGMDEFDRLLS